MNKMKKLCFIFVPLFLTLSCTTEKNLNLLPQSEASLESFAILLSKAVYNEPELRSFIKDEALKRVDYDYDVVYTFVKDEEVAEGKTFEMVLRQYDDRGLLAKIADQYPLLTILVPDWAWVCEDCFSPQKWDTSCPCVGVSTCDNEKEHPVFCEGSLDFYLKNGEFCDTPILIVKNNDRLVYNAKTKSGASSGLKFFCDDFSDTHMESPRTKGKSSTYTTFYLPYEAATDTVDISSIDQRLIDAYNIFQQDNRVEHRDHIYYGMTSSVDSGYVNRHCYEHIEKIKLSPVAIGCFDDPINGTSTGTDYSFISRYYLAHGAGQATRLTYEDIAAMSWGEGALEIIIKAYVGSNTIRKGLSIPFEDAFYVKKVKLRENYNNLHYLTSRTYYLDVDIRDGYAGDWLEPKWINVNQDLFCWNVAECPIYYFVDFVEHDDKNTTTISTHKTFSWMTNVSASVDVSVSALKVGFGCGYSQTTTRTCTYQEVVDQGDDDLMNFEVNYADKVVLGYDSNGVKMKVYHTGYVDAMIYPVFE